MGKQGTDHVKALNNHAIWASVDMRKTVRVLGKNIAKEHLPFGKMTLKMVWGMAWRGKR